MTCMRLRFRQAVIGAASLCVLIGFSFSAAADDKPVSPGSSKPSIERSQFEVDPALPAGARDRKRAEEAATDAKAKAEEATGETSEAAKKRAAIRKAAAEKRKKSGKYSIHKDLDGQFARAMQIQNQHTPRLLAQKGVTGTGLGLGSDRKPVIRVYLTGFDKPTIPAELDGIRVVPVKTGMITPLAVPQSNWKIAPKKPGSGISDIKGRKKVQGPVAAPAKPKSSRPKAAPFDNFFPTDFWDRPVPIGISSAPIVADCYSGTLGCRIILRSDTGNVYALSNNHVFADENNGVRNSTVIVQPSPGDNFDCAASANQPNRIGVLTNFIPINFDGTTENIVDAAVAKMDPGTLGFATPPEGYGAPVETTALPVIGDFVQKMGRTSGYTFGEITATNVTVLVTYTAGAANFVNQVEVGGFGDSFGSPGDSGSLIVDLFNQPVALLFAGNGVSTWGNRIELVLQQLDLEFPVPPIDPDDGGVDPTPGKRGRYTGGGF